MDKNTQRDMLICIIKKAMNAHMSIPKDMDDFVTLDGNDFDHIAEDAADEILEKGFRVVREETPSKSVTKIKIVLNKCCGGYGLSKEAYEFLGLEWDETNEEFSCGEAFEYDRTNPQLVKCVETLGEKANAPFADLVVVEIPDGVEYEIEDDIGYEWIEINETIY